MADYGIKISDNGDGTFTITTCMRAPTTTTITGGTTLLTNTFTQTASTGVVTAISGFLDSATDPADGLGHKLRSPLEALQRCIAYIAGDRSFNG